MEKIGLFEAIDQATEYKKMLPANRQQLRKKRLFELVSHARSNSPFFKELYKDLPLNYNISDLPRTDRSMLNQAYDEWSTDRDVTAAGIHDYLDKHPDQDKPYLKKYHVISSSGTDSTPLINLVDQNNCRIMSVEYMMRSFARREYLWHFLLKGCRLAAIYTTGGPYFSNTFLTIRQKFLPLRSRHFLLLQAQASTEELAQSLNRFKPAILSGFPSVLLRLCDEQTTGRLHIKPVCIIADGEYLDDESRAKLSSSFDCDVLSSYSSAETGVIAYECREHHLHLNDDRIILEPVDDLGRPVAPGTESDMVLVTNLLSFPQPIIRYALGDRVIVHDEECLCGNPSCWIEVKGRSMDRLRLIDGTKKIIVPISDMEAVLKDEESIRRYQIVIFAGCRLSLRLSASEGYDRTAAFFRAEKLMRSYMKSIGILSPMITLDKDEPLADPYTGKFKTIIVES
jgi:phenylacetate-coenzyme A ligase PaaK-like adenylate-forming protein